MSLLKVKLEHPAVWEGFQPYLSSLPGEEDVHTLFSFRKDLIPLLQDPEMVRPWQLQCHTVIALVGIRHQNVHIYILSQACCVYQHSSCSVLQPASLN